MNEMKKIIVYGNFQEYKDAGGGQITKTRNVFDLLSCKYGKENVGKLNMEKWKQRPFRIVRLLIKALKQCQHLFVLPGDNNLKFLLKIFKLFSKRISCHIHYMVVGGWLYDYLKDRETQILIVKSFAGVYVETKDLKSKLETLGLDNIFYSPVFSTRKYTNKARIEENISYLKNANSLKVCTFSRVSKEKGIGDAIEAVKLINKQKVKCFLDIYGPIDPLFDKEFKQLIRENTFVSYSGFIPDNDVIEVLAKYHLMIFPTYFYGEGFPACLLESYMAGTPVVATDWKYNKELVDINITGRLCKPHNPDSIAKEILDVLDDDKTLYQMRFNCLKKALLFTPDKAMEPVFKRIEEISHN